MALSDPKGGGWKSRKFWFAAGSVLIVALMAGLVQAWPAIGTVYGTMCLTVSAIVTAYLGGNVGQQLVAAKAQKPQAEESPAEKSP